jgi:hypothetical protein
MSLKIGNVLDSKVDHFEEIVFYIIPWIIVPSESTEPNRAFKNTEYKE